MDFKKIIAYLGGGRSPYQIILSILSLILNSLYAEANRKQGSKWLANEYTNIKAKVVGGK